jgi:DNA (cytosine-5)-methyltransferase 1
MTLTMGELFMGYGGLGLGVQDALADEVDLAWCAEIDPAAVKVIRHRFPRLRNHGDVTAVDWTRVQPVDVLTGGSPCQDLSDAGRRAGMSPGTRSNLWVAMREAVAVLRPKLVVWENVRGAYGAPADSSLEQCPGCVGDPGTGGPVLRALGRVLGDLADLGYVGGWAGVRACDVGAPHPRFRVFVAAHPRGLRFPGGRLLAPGQTPGDRAQAQAPRRGDESLKLFPTPQVQDERHSASNAQHRIDQGRQIQLSHAVALLPTPTTRDYKGQNQRRDVSCLPGAVLAPDWGQYAPAIERWEDLTRTAPLPTYSTPKGNLALAPEFTEWLMGLPAGFVTGVPGLSRADQLRILGNGVVPQQAAHAVSMLLRQAPA